MKQIDFYFDFVSPFAYLAFETLPQALLGCSYQVRYRPILFAGLLKTYGQKGPAEIEPKRIWTYRQVAWLARQLGVPFQMPTQHPFNPLGLLRLALAVSDGEDPNRHVCETIFRQAWSSGQDASAPEFTQQLATVLGASPDLSSEQVKLRLRQNTEEAIARGVFGVPTMVVDEQIFWGLDALPMLKAYLDGEPDLSAHAAAAGRVLPYGV